MHNRLYIERYSSIPDSVHLVVSTCMAARAQFQNPICTEPFCCSLPHAFMPLCAQQICD